MKNPLKHYGEWINPFTHYGRRIKWAWQRVRYGVSDRDAWSLFNHLEGVLAIGIQTMVDNSHSYRDWCPAFEPHAPCDCMERWENDMLSAVHVMQKLADEDFYEDVVLTRQPGQILPTGDFTAAWDEEKAYREWFYLFIEDYWEHLWD